MTSEQTSSTQTIIDIFLFIVFGILFFVFVGINIVSAILFLVLYLFVVLDLVDWQLGLLMLLPVFVAGWLIGSGWGDIAMDATASVSEDVGASEAFGAAFSTIGEGVSDAWLMITCPACYANKTVGDEPPERDEYTTKYALEIEDMDVRPDEVGPNQVTTFIYELENRGDNTATILEIGASLSDSAADNGAHIISNDGQVWNRLYREQGLNQNVEIGQMNIESFGIMAPDCSGSFSVNALLTYQYEVKARRNLELASKEYYEEGTMHDNLVWNDQTTLVSSGPFMLSLATDLSQPIPVENPFIDAAVTDPLDFTLYFQIENERDGRANINTIYLNLPKELEKTSEFESTCDFFKASDQTGVDSGYTKYYIKQQSSSFLRDDNGVWAASAGSGNIDKGILIDSKLSAVYRCHFHLDRLTISDMKKKEQDVKTLSMESIVNYNYTTTKKTTFKVPKTLAESTCTEKEAQEIPSKIDSDAGVPVKRDEALTLLAESICECADYWTDWEDKACSKHKVNIQGCSADEAITIEDIREEMKNLSYADKCPAVKANTGIVDSTQFWMKNPRRVSVNVEDSLGTLSADDWTLYPNSEYTINIDYKQTVFGLFPSLKVAITNNNTDSLECYMSVWDPCKENNMCREGYECNLVKTYLIHLNNTGTTGIYEEGTSNFNQDYLTLKRSTINGYITTKLDALLRKGLLLSEFDSDSYYDYLRNIPDNNDLLSRHVCSHIEYIKIKH